MFKQVSLVKFVLMTIIGGGFKRLEVVFDSRVQQRSQSANHTLVHQSHDTQQIQIYRNEMQSPAIKFRFLVGSYFRHKNSICWVLLIRYMIVGCIQVP